ncbi:BspA family leucine-rich repeat surface protein [Tamlana sp. 62-3]|uniref:BspA family leucine-rich repeat surface protein n=1 Tax=Neotamlana sargassicola TaxID=2883125 RepID=A0A9X1I681_9FLAO|nr:BspA family leucine-rich repeat surface protein [Tamlana sargassicola]MCB4807494.1 BspA family leucine-rich repeat surface protein [Tamlana sargassicola]
MTLKYTTTNLIFNIRLLIIISALNSFYTFAGTTPFVTTWLAGDEVDNFGIRLDNSVLILTNGNGHNFTVDWGDGNITTNHTGNASHDYEFAGIYTVSITGDFPNLNFAYQDRLLTIEQWGDNKWTSMHNMFNGCYRLKGNYTDRPDTSNVNDMSYMFYGAQSFNEYIANWDISNVTNMENMFFNAYNFNQDLGNWNVSNVINMSNLFTNARSFNQNIGNWNVSKVTSMSSMFEGTSFNHDIGNWNVAQVTDMSNMFYLNADFNHDITRWDVSNVMDMKQMFSHAFKFNQDISVWDVSNVLNMSNMFYAAEAFNQDIGIWDVSKVTNMELMFGLANNFDQDLSNWNVSNVLKMFGMFTGITLSTPNYDSLLIGWSKLNLSSNVEFHGGYSTYCSAEDAREKIITEYNWNIIDGGSVAPILNNLTDQNVVDNFIFPQIKGEKLTGNEKYYTQPDGNGMAYNSGDSINFEDFDSYPIQLYIYSKYNAYCSSEVNFPLTIISSAINCSNLTFPTPGATNVDVSTNINWNNVKGAEGYKLSIGTNFEANNIIDSLNVANTTTFTPEMALPQNQTIFVKITPYNAITESESCLIDSFKTVLTYTGIPKYFTPNNDGYNDKWIIPETVSSISNVLIFNRYGKLLKQLNDPYSGWDGTYSKKMLPNDDYWYKIIFTDGSWLTGHFSLIH